MIERKRALGLARACSVIAVLAPCDLAAPSADPGAVCI